MGFESFWTKFKIELEKILKYLTIVWKQENMTIMNIRWKILNKQIKKQRSYKTVLECTWQNTALNERASLSHSCWVI